MLVDPEQSAKYWTEEKDKGQLRLRLKIHYKLRLINNPVFKAELKNLPELEDMQIFRQPQATNFLVTNSEWQVIVDLLKKRFGFAQANDKGL